MSQDLSHLSNNIEDRITKYFKLIFINLLNITSFYYLFQIDFHGKVTNFLHHTI